MIIIIVVIIALVAYIIVRVRMITKPKKDEPFEWFNEVFVKGKKYNHKNQ